MRRHFTFNVAIPSRMVSGNPYEIEKAIPLLERVIALDSEYADAWVRLGLTYITLSHNPISKRIPAEVSPIAIDAFRTALKIDPGPGHHTQLQLGLA